MLKKLSKTLDWIEDVLFYFGGILVIFSMLSISLEVFSRLFNGASIMWVNEINEYILLYIPFLGAAWLVRENGHVVIDLIDGRLSQKMNQLNFILIASIGIIISVAFVWYGLLSTIDAYVRDVRSISVLKIPQVYVLVAIPIGSAVMLFEFVRMLYRYLFGTFSLSKNAGNEIETSQIKGESTWNGG